MAFFIAISGPSLTGKTTLVNLLQQVVPNAIYVPDMQDLVWSELRQSGTFTEYMEITKDRDYLLTFFMHEVTSYRKALNDLSNEESLIIMDGSYIDLLIYSMLSMWYHYPTAGILEDSVNQLLAVKEKISLVYMSQADDNAFKPTSKNVRSRLTAFKKNRPLELSYYEIFSDSSKVVKLPSANVMDCDQFIKNDLLERGLL